MELVTALCPACKQEIKVNAVETVDVCKLCGKSFKIVDAIHLYREKLEREIDARKPPQQVIDRFNLLLRGDIDKAYNYFIGFVQKEFPKFYYDKLIPNRFYYLDIKEINSNGVFYKDAEEQTIKSVNYAREHLEYIGSINPYIAGMYLKIFSAYVNKLLSENTETAEQAGVAFKEDLPFLKLQLGNIKTRIKNIIDQLYKIYDDSATPVTEKQSFAPYDDVVRIINKYKNLQGKEYDDNYILYVIDYTDRLAHSYPVEQGLGTGNKHPLTCGEYIMNYCNEGLEDIINLLAAFLSPAGQDKLARQREKLVKERESLANAERQRLYDTELSHWQHYVYLLQRGEIKDAEELLHKGNVYAYTSEAVMSEMSKFKKGIFGWKYTGNADALTGEALTELDLKNLTYGVMIHFKRTKKE